MHNCLHISSYHSLPFYLLPSLSPPSLTLSSSLLPSPSFSFPSSLPPSPSLLPPPSLLPSLPPPLPQASSSELKEDVLLASRVLEAVTTGNSKDVERALADVTEQLFPRIEVQLIKAAVTSGNMEVLQFLPATFLHFMSDQEHIVTSLHAPGLIL